MTFIEALKSGRPMRRPWHTGQSPWLHLGEDSARFGQTIPGWRRIDTGERTGLARWDYAATDWEVMP